MNQCDVHEFTSGWACIVWTGLPKARHLLLCKSISLLGSLHFYTKVSLVVDLFNATTMVLDERRVHFLLLYSWGPPEEDRCPCKPGRHPGHVLLHLLVGLRTVSSLWLAWLGPRLTASSLPVRL